MTELVCVAFRRLFWVLLSAGRQQALPSSRAILETCLFDELLDLLNTVKDMDASASI